MTANRQTSVNWRLSSRLLGRRRRQGGWSMLYAIIGLPVIAGFCSFAVDYGHAQLVKTELRRTADATAHDYMVLYSIGGKSYATQNGPYTSDRAQNPVESLSGVDPTIKVTWGTWDPATKTFTSGSSGTGDMAVRVTASYTKAKGNAVPLLFGSVLGIKSVDVSASAVATYVNSQNVNVTVDATSNPYFAGMPSTSISANGDTAIANAATQVTSIPVRAGDILTFTNFTGTASVILPYMPLVGPQGAVGNFYGSATRHGVSWDGTGSPHTENGIADAIMPESSLMGLFLDDNAPDSTPAPSTVVDWTQSAQKNKTIYSSLKPKEPFYIGDGKNGGAIKQFIVPPGATRFYMAAWDGIQFNNNSGGFSGTITRTPAIKIVQ